MEEPVPPRRLPDRVCDAIRVRHYRIRTEEACVGWIRRFILFHRKRHPDSMGAEHVNAIRTYLATGENAGPSRRGRETGRLSHPLVFLCNASPRDGCDIRTIQEFWATLT